MAFFIYNYSQNAVYVIPVLFFVVYISRLYNVCDILLIDRCFTTQLPSLKVPV